MIPKSHGIPKCAYTIYMIHLGERQLRLLLGSAASRSTSANSLRAVEWACGCCAFSAYNGLFELQACEYHDPLLALITPRADDYSLKTSEPIWAELYGR